MSSVHHPHHSHRNRQQGIIEWDKHDVGDGVIHSDGGDFFFTVLDVVSVRAPTDGTLVSFVPQAQTDEPRARWVAIAEDPLPGPLMKNH